MLIIFKKETIAFVLLSILSFVLIRFDSDQSFELFKGAKTVASSVHTGVSYGVSYIKHPIDQFKKFFLFEKIEKDYQEQLLRYRGLEKELISLRNDNLRLRELNDIKPKLIFQYTEARILARDPQNFFDFLMINRGARDGIKKDMPVVAYSEDDGVFCLIGRIEKVSERSSQILPIYDKRNFVAIRLANQRYEGLLTGTGNVTSFADISYIPVDFQDNIARGDFVVTSGIDSDMSLNSIYPAGIYIGKINNIEINKHLMSLAITAKSLVNFSQLEEVFVITSSEPLQYTPEATEPTATSNQFEDTFAGDF